MSKIDEANKVGSAINNWLKIGGVAVAAISSCTYAYYLILTLGGHQSDTDKEVDALKEDLKRQYKVFSEKDEKKEAQIKEAGAKFLDWMIKHEERLNTLQEENAYQKGLIEELQKKR